MEITLVRHGEPNYAIDSLTPKGFREAELLADRLCRMDVRDFYVSPLGRAQDTALTDADAFEPHGGDAALAGGVPRSVRRSVFGRDAHSVEPRAPVLDDAAPVLRSAALARPSAVSERHRGRNLRRDRRGHGTKRRRRATAAFVTADSTAASTIRTTASCCSAISPCKHGHSGPHAQPLAGGALGTACRSSPRR